MTLLILLLLFVGVVVLGVVEYRTHIKNLTSIPIRVHVNGTRGKSSVTRLIAAGLREGGVRTFAKTTGTLPRMIVADGTEYPIHRNLKANVIEQIRIVSFAANNNAEALVIECMALQPLLQSLCELKLIKATHGVITNTREDHLDVMGPTERDVALALLGTTPVNATLFTCEKDYVGEFTDACNNRNSGLVIASDEDSERISDEEMQGFQYIEHKENVALALKVCEAIGVTRETALQGMHKTQPDVGAMEDCTIDFFARKIQFINGFAANDPESTARIWNMAIVQHKDVDSKIMIINSRADRPDRSRQIGEALVTWPMADKYILIGSGSYFLIKYAVKNGFNPKLFVNAEERVVENIFEEILNYCKRNTLIIGVGNIAGPGMELIKYFYNRRNLD